MSWPTFSPSKLRPRDAESPTRFFAAEDGSDPPIKNNEAWALCSLRLGGKNHSGRMKLIRLVLSLAARAVAAVAADAPAATTLNVLVVGGGSSHAFAKWWGEVDLALLNAMPGVKASYTEDTDSIVPMLATTDVLYLANNKPFTQEATRNAIMDFARAGRGGVILGHAGMWYSWNDWAEFNSVIAGGGARGHDRVAPFEVKVTAPTHPIMKDVPATFQVSDELYWYIPEPAGTPIKVLATVSSPSKKAEFPSIFVVDLPKARIAGIALGHDAGSHDTPAYRQLLKNTILWAAGR